MSRYLPTLVQNVNLALGLFVRGWSTQTVVDTKAQQQNGSTTLPPNFHLSLILKYLKGFLLMMVVSKEEQ